MYVSTMYVLIVSKCGGDSLDRSTYDDDIGGGGGGGRGESYSHGIAYYYYYFIIIYNAPCIRVKNLLKGANKVMLNNFK